MDDTPASWQLYFRDEQFSLDDRRLSLITSLCSFFLRPEGWEFLSRVRYVLRQRIVLYIDFGMLQKQSQIVDLQAAIDLQPIECLGCLGAAAFECLFESDQYTDKLNSLLRVLPPPGYVHIRPYSIKSLYVGIRNVLSGAVGATLCPEFACPTPHFAWTMPADHGRGLCRKTCSSSRNRHSAVASQSCCDRY